MPKQIFYRKARNILNEQRKYATSKQIFTQQIFYKEGNKYFESITKCPVIVNTSFNVRDEPIVCSVQDAYQCFMGTDLDILVCEDFILYKEKQNNQLLKDYRNKFKLD